MRSGTSVALRPLPPLVVVLALAGVAVAAGVAPKTVHVAAAKSVSRPVQGVTLVCPSVPTNTPDLVTRTDVATSRPGLGQALVQELLPAGQQAQQQVVPLATGVTAVTLPIGPPLVVTATGPASGGVVATRVTRGDQGQMRGISVDTCTQPRTDAWFVGASTAPGQDATLEVVNADDAPAEVNIQALTPSGILTPVATTGRTVPPHSQLDVPLDQLAPGVATSAVEVVATRGRVASSMREVRGLNAIDPGGVDAVPQALGAAKTVVLTGLIGTVNGTVLDLSRLHHVLTVGVPGVADATVHVTVTDEDGSFVPTGLDAITVPAGTVKQIDLDGALNAERATLQVTSDEGVPLVAGVLIDAQAHIGDYHDTLQIGAATPLSGPTVFPDARVGSDAHDTTDTILSVTALAGAADVTVTTGGMPFGIAVPQGRVNEVKAHIGSKTDTSLVVTPAAGSPPVYAAATIEELGFNGPLIGGAAVSGGLASVRLPVATESATLPLVDAAH